MQPREPVLGIGAKYTKNRDAGIGGYFEKLSTFRFRETNSRHKLASQTGFRVTNGVSRHKLASQTGFRITNSRHKRNSNHKLASQKPSSDFNLVPQPMF